MNDAILAAAEECIPKRELKETKCTHPWLTTEVEQFVKAKKLAEGTPNEQEAREACSDAILKGYQAFKAKSAIELREMKPGAKAWWSKTRKLLDSKPRCSHIPVLRSAEGSWMFDPEKKASLIAKTFQRKYKLVPPEENEYTPVVVADQRQLQQDVPTEADAAGILRNLGDR